MFARSLIAAAVIVAATASSAFAGGGSFYGGMYRGFDSPNFNRGGGSGGIGNASPWVRRSNSYAPTGVRRSNSYTPTRIYQQRAR